MRQRQPRRLDEALHGLRHVHADSRTGSNTGTATVAQNVFRDYIVTFNTATTDAPASAYSWAAPTAGDPLNEIPKPIDQAMKLWLSHFYENREPVPSGRIVHRCWKLT